MVERIIGNGPFTDQFITEPSLLKGLTNIMATETKTSEYRRASDTIKGLGENLDKIAGTDMLLHEFTIEEGRAIGEKENTLVTMYLSTIADPENKIQFHAWSQSVADRLTELTNAEVELPVIIQFNRVPTARGFKVWAVS